MGAYLVAGLMSGTSLDGVDAVLARFELDEHSGSLLDCSILGSHLEPLPEAIVSRLQAWFSRSTTDLADLALLDFDLAECFAAAAEALFAKTACQRSDIRLLASHGQTVWHVAGAPGSPRRASLQLGNGAVLAQRCCLPVVCDFRSGDIAAGGTGAPLVPHFLYSLTGRLDKPLAFQNYGGIGNICFLGSSGQVAAFDTGPGNMIIDTLVKEWTSGKERCDFDGCYGQQGRIVTGLLDGWLSHDFLKQAAPKSCGREDFGFGFYQQELAALLQDARSRDDRQLFCDLVRTAEVFTAASTADACLRLLPEPAGRMYVSGGGAHNPVIMRELADRLPDCKVDSVASLGLSVDYLEAVAFAWFGLLRYLGLPNTLPSATGATRAVSAGALYLP